MKRQLKLITQASTRNPFVNAPEGEPTATKGELRRGLARAGDMVRKVVAPLTRRMTELEDENDDLRMRLEFLEAELGVKENDDE